MRDIFISYSHKDTSFVRDIVPALEAEGFSVWWDHIIPPGKTWDDETARQIRDAKACIVVWSPHSIISDWVKEEATLAKEGGKYLPILIGVDQPPIGFRRIQAADLRNWNCGAQDPKWRMLINEAAKLVRGELAAEDSKLPPGRAPRVTDETLLGPLVSGSSGRSKAKQRAFLGAVATVVVLTGLVAWWRVLSERRAAVTVTSQRLPGTISKPKVAELLQLLGIDVPQEMNGDWVTGAALLNTLKTAPRRAHLGSSQEQIDAAFAVCAEHTSDCKREWFADETSRDAVLQPFKLDFLPVSVRDFRQFVSSSNYRTAAEINGVAYSAVDGRLKPIKGGNWRNAVGSSSPPDEDSAVVGVNYADAQAYCAKHGKRLPTEDEWEYAARGPEGHVYPWGDDLGSAGAHLSSQPRVTDGPAEGIGGTYRGLSGAVWEWASTDVDGRKVLKGGSWRESDPASKRAATRGYELPDRANGSTGFRCAESMARWPDAEFWMKQIHGS
jgi:hypothetical protein